MKISTYQSKEDWLNGRLGKITGSRVKDIIVKRGTGKKKGYYELIAERIATRPDGENPLERGNRLEPEAITRFEAETEQDVDRSLVIWSRDEDDSIAISPDGFMGLTEAIEVKCLSSASHIEAYLTQEVPSEYKDQIIQYFVVNDLLEKVHVVFYDPRILFKDYFVIEVTRENVQDEVVEYLEYQRNVLKEVEEIVLKLTNF